MPWVYLITTHDTRGNSHGINRDEVWTVTRHQLFDTDEEAHDYILNKSPIFTDLPLFTEKLTPEQKLKFTEEFCFTNPMYYKYRRLFIGKPDTREMKKSLEEDGVNFIKI